MGGVIGMGSDAYDFDEQLEMGLEMEQRLSERLESILTSINLENIAYSDQPEIQRSGIDSILRKKNVDFEIKSQRYEHTKTGNLPIEVVSVLEEQEPGWYHYSEADIIVWVYHNKPKPTTNYHNVGYFMLFDERFKDWFEEREESFRFVSVPNEGRYGEYHTGNRLVPIEEIPDEWLIEFDPRLPTDKETPQSDITEWLNHE